MHEAKDSVNCLAVRRWQIITGSVDRCVRVYDIRKGGSDYSVEMIAPSLTFTHFSKK